MDALKHHHASDGGRPAEKMMYFHGGVQVVNGCTSPSPCWMTLTKDFACLQCKYHGTWRKSLCLLNHMGFGCTSPILYVIQLFFCSYIISIEVGYHLGLAL